MLIHIRALVQNQPQGPFQLARDGFNALAIMTDPGNGALVAVSMFYGLAGNRYANAVEVVKPDSSAVPITSLVGAAKLGVVPLLAGAVTDVWVMRTDADASAAADVYLSGVKE